MPASPNLVGQAFGQLMVLSRLDRKQESTGGRYWRCACSCGNETEVTTSRLRARHTISCGCVASANLQRRMTRGGRTKSSHPEHAIYRRERTVKSKYGLDSIEYASMLKAQNNRCAVCLNLFEGKNFAHVDHCHTTGKIRGLLCRTCNLGIGHLKDDINLVQSAADYLEKFSGS